MFTTRPVLSGTFGMVAINALAGHRGGHGRARGGWQRRSTPPSAGGFVLHVVEPHLNGPGGDMPAVFATRRRPTPRCSAARARPRPARPSALPRRLGLDLVPGTGPLAAAVPGAVGAWLLLLRDHGTLALGDVLGYAIGYAEDGHPLLPAGGRDHRRGRRAVPRRTGRPRPSGGCPTGARPGRGGLRAAGAGRDATGGCWPQAQRPRPGGAASRRRQRLVHAASSRRRSTLRRARWRTTPAGRTPGVLTGADLGRLEADVRAAGRRSDWRGWTVAKPAAWGQGPVLLQQLALLGGADLPARPGGADADPPRASRRRSWRSPTGRPGTATPRRRRWTTCSHRPTPPSGARWSATPHRSSCGPGRRAAGRRGCPVRRGRRRRRGPAPPSPGEPTVRRDGATRGDTCHVDVVDRWGNLVSATPSGGWLQSVPDRPRARLLPRHPGADDLAAGRPALDAAPGTAAPDHAVARRWCCATASPVLASARPAATSRTSGSCCFLLAHARRRARPAGRDRRPGLAHRTRSRPRSHRGERAGRGGGGGPGRAGGVVAGLRPARPPGRRLGRLVARPAVRGRPATRATGILSAAANARGMQGYAVGR